MQEKFSIGSFMAVFSPVIDAAFEEKGKVNEISTDILKKCSQYLKLLLKEDEFFTAGNPKNFPYKEKRPLGCLLDWC